MATIHTPTPTQEENKDATVIATVHPQASPSSPSSSSLHAPTSVNNSGTRTFNVCSDLPSLKDLDDNMDDDDKTMTTTRTTIIIIKKTKTGPVIPEKPPPPHLMKMTMSKIKQQPQLFFLVSLQSPSIVQSEMTISLVYSHLTHVLV